MATRTRLVPWIALAAVAALTGIAVLMILTPVRASDHADPIDVFRLRGSPLEAGTTDLFFFPRTDEQGTRRMEVILCVRRALTDPGTLKLTPYTYTINIDTTTPVAFDSDEDLKRYGGSVVRPDQIRANIAIRIRLNDDATLASAAYEGLGGDLQRVRIQTGIFDDPFIFPTFFRTNTVAMVLSIPLGAFPGSPKHWLVWGTSSRDGKQIDHVGRSLRTQNPRFELLNTLPPSQHVAAIEAEIQRPSLMREVLWKKANLQQIFQYRMWDKVPDVMIYSSERPVGFPNGRLLTDDVAELLATYGDTLLKEISYIAGGWPRATTNDMPFRLRPDGGCGQPAPPDPRRCDQTVPENLEFPYLAQPWKERPQAAPPSLSSANQTKLWLIGFGVVALLILTHWLVAKWYCRRQLRLRYL